MNILILLIGSNPLPNYIVADYLLNEERNDQKELPIPDTLILIHSNGTKDFKNNIVNLLLKHNEDEREILSYKEGETPKVSIKNIKEKKINKIISIDLKNDERNSNMIINGIIYTISGLIQSGESIESVHLNNTAGTKPMAVYSTVSLFLLQNTINPIFTDLDPNTSRLEKTMFENFTLDNKLFEIKNNSDLEQNIKKIDIKNIVKTEIFPSETKTLMDYVNPSIEDIIKLHKIEKSKPTDRFKLINFKKFKEEALEYKYNKKLNIRYWCDKIEDIERKNNGKSVTYYKPDDMSKYLLDLDKDFFCDNDQHITNDFNSLKVLFNDSNGFVYPEGNKANYFKLFIKSFMGEWLEEYITLLLEEIQKNNTIFDKYKIFTSFRGKSTSKDNKGRATEIDIIVKKSFQLYIITCTTWDKVRTVKGKVFEALYRANQLGGGNSKVISVSLLKENPLDNNDEDNLETLKKDFTQFDAEKNVRYIGLEDLQNEDNLKDKLQKWIFEDNWNHETEAEE